VVGPPSVHQAEHEEGTEDRMSAVEQIEYVSVERAIPMRRVWAMPDSCTFNIPPIRSLVRSYLHKATVSVDPFARNKQWATYTNDLNPETAAEYHVDAGDFLQTLVGREVKADLVIFDPPYSLHQAKECYADVGRKFMMADAQNVGRWTRERELIARLCRPGGIVITCGWNSQGVGLQHDFEQVEILLVCHGGAHNDTIVTVERKIESKQISLL